MRKINIMQVKSSLNWCRIVMEKPRNFRFFSNKNSSEHLSTCCRSCLTHGHSAWTSSNTEFFLKSSRKSKTFLTNVLLFANLFIFLQVIFKLFAKSNQQLTVHFVSKTYLQENLLPYSVYPRLELEYYWDNTRSCRKDFPLAVISCPLLFQ